MVVFSVAGPAAWNCLSDKLREPLLTANSLRQLLKTRLFAEYTSAYSALDVLHIMRYTYLLSTCGQCNYCLYNIKKASLFIS